MATQSRMITRSLDRLRNTHAHPEVRRMDDLLTQIEQWERDSTSKINLVAAKTRNKLQELRAKIEARRNTVSSISEEQRNTVSRISEKRRNRPNTKENSKNAKLVHPNERTINEREELETRLNMRMRLYDYLPPFYPTRPKRKREDSTSSSGVSSAEIDGLLKTIITSHKKLSASLPDFLVPQNDPTENEAESLLDPTENEAESLLDPNENEAESPLDPTKDNNLILLQLSNVDVFELSEDLQKLTDHHSSLLNKTNDWLTELKQLKQATLVVDMHDMLLKDQDNVLSELSQLEHIRSVYVRATPPQDDNDRQSFFSKYPIIKAMSEYGRSVAVQWAMDTANEYRKFGDICVENGEKEKAQLWFTKGVKLYKRLSTFLNEKRH